MIYICHSLTCTSSVLTAQERQFAISKVHNKSCPSSLWQRSQCSLCCAVPRKSVRVGTALLLLAPSGLNLTTSCGVRRNQKRAWERVYAPVFPFSLYVFCLTKCCMVSLCATFSSRTLPFVCLFVCFKYQLPSPSKKLTKWIGAKILKKLKYSLN